MKKKIPIGSKVIYGKEEHTLLGYRVDRTACVIEGPSGRHSGNVLAFWYDEHGNRIPYIEGDNRYFVHLIDIKPVRKEEPEFIFNI